MADKIIDFISQYLSGFVIVFVAIGVFLGMLYLASLNPNKSLQTTKDRTRACLQMRVPTCF